jgi:Fe-S cluster biogenesis protein NfuA
MGFISKILGVDHLERSFPQTRAESPIEFDAENDSFEDRVEAVLESVRPALHADGGDIELVEIVGRSATVRLVGACDGCPSAALTLRFGIEKKMKEAIPEFEELIAV